MVDEHNSIRRSKTDQAEEGSVAYLSQTTVGWPQQRLENAEIGGGALFRRLIGRGNVGDRLHGDSVADIFKRVAVWIRMPAKQVGRVNGHSVRVGAMQDLLALNIDLASVMQAGRWKSLRSHDAAATCCSRCCVQPAATRDPIDNNIGAPPALG